MLIGPLSLQRLFSQEPMPTGITNVSPTGNDWRMSQDEIQRMASRLDADNWGEGFFDLDGTIDPTDDQPSQHKIVLPPLLEQVEPLQQSEMSPEMTGWIRWLILRNLPPTYEDKRKWGKQKEVFDGIDFDRQGLRIETHRRYKKLDHGTWSRYFVELIDPAEQLQIRLYEMQETRPGVIQFRIMVEAPVKVFGQMTRYQWNVKAFSISAHANARVRMNVLCELEIQLNPLAIPPSVTLKPKVSEANVELHEFKVTRISHMKGPIAKFLGSSLRDLLDRKLQEYDDKLVEKTNKQLDKQKEHFHLSAEKWFASAVEEKAKPK